MPRENIHFETAILVSLVLHVAVLGGSSQSAALARLPVIGAIVRALTPSPSASRAVAAAASVTTPPKPPEPTITFVEEPATPKTPPAPERPKQFIETDNSQVTGEKPKNTDFYSDRSTVAANPDNPTKKTGDTPFLDGNDTRMLSTADVVPGNPGNPLPPGPPRPSVPAAPAAPATPASPANTALLSPSTPTSPATMPDAALLPSPKPGASASLLKPIDLPTRTEHSRNIEPEKKEDGTPSEKPKPEVKSPGETKGVKEGAEPKGVLEKPKPVPDEGLKARPETKLAMLTPPQQPKTVPLPPPPPPEPETPAVKPELKLQQPAPTPPPAMESSPGSVGHPEIPGGGGGTGAASAGTGREIAARKSRLNMIGVDRRGIAAFNVADSPFGPYDKEVVRAVQSRWYALIQKNGLYERAGEVTIHFQLLADGSVTNASVKASTAGEILALFCQKAIVESGPFAPWPEDLRIYLGNEPRDVDFTFYY
jgi:hypothetical protein